MLCSLVSQMHEPSKEGEMKSRFKDKKRQDFYERLVDAGNPETLLERKFWGTLLDAFINGYNNLPVKANRRYPVHSAAYVAFVTSLTASIRKLGLYSIKHPTIVSSIRSLHASLEKLLGEKEEAHINLSSDGQIFIEDHLAGEKGSRLAEDLGRYFKKLEIESLVINSGITDKELGEFISILALSADEAKKIGDLNKLFAEKKIAHIKVAQFSYIKVQKGKKGA